MSNRFAVENLPSGITPGALKELFAQVGEVHTVTIAGPCLRDKVAVEMTLDLDAYRAVNCFNGTIINGRRIRLTELA